MKKILSFLLAVIMIIPVNRAAAAVTQPEITAPSAILIEAGTGKIIYEKNPDEVLRPASITKIMTLILIFDALDEGKISMTDSVTVSEHAASMGGSQVYLEAGEIQTVETMIKCIAIASANDACVAMAEYISGSEDAFVDAMNERAASLSMKNTHFVNSCGLDAEGHTTTARDVAAMARELSERYPEIHEISTIWMDTITHVTRRGEQEFVLNNTNKLLKQYEWATGLKTGSTSLAGFCLAATAERNGLELISVVMAAGDGKSRISDSITLLNYGYSVCSLYVPDSMPNLPVQSIKGSIKGTFSCTYAGDFSYIFTEPYDASALSYTMEFLKDIKAPLSSGDIVGQLTFYYNSMPIGCIDILSSEEVRKSSYGDYLHLLFSELLSV